MDESIYLQALESSLEKICFDRTSGETYDFADLFYPLDVDEGRVAFQSYSEQMDKVHKLSTVRQKSQLHYGTSQLHTTPVVDLLLKIHKAQEKLEKKSNYESDIDFENDENRGNTKNNENKPVGKAILEKIRHQTLKQQGDIPVEIDSKTKNEVVPDIDLLLEEQKGVSHSSLIVNDKKAYSRILAVASAGYGKTTLLRRIALFFCHPLSISAEDVRIKKKYSLEGKFIPCLIQLRDIGDNSLSIDRAIEDSIINVFNTWNIKSNAEESVNSTDIQCWIDSIKPSLLLLIDGLDELSDSMRLNFLLSLDDYLLSYPKTHIIMTSRVAGLSEPGIKDVLKKMKFRGRSIIPLSDEEAKSYSEKWITVTQPEEQHVQLFDAIEQILNQNRFKYLREFMRTPLELLVILKQLANDTLSLNRFQMFHDMLWELFTSHVKRYDKKRPVFDDTMTFLSFIAYKMQLNDSLYISKTELNEVLDELGNLSFHTDIIQNGTLENYISLLDELAANVGIIEKDDRASEAVFTFPIRAYQEFLTAHACCHLRLSTDSFKPAPQKIVKEHITDTRWISIINFVLSDLSTTNQVEFDAIVNLLFSEISDYEQLRSIVEADLAITRSHAQILCDNNFSSERLDSNMKELLIACLNSKSAYAYAHVLKTSYINQKDSSNYLEASAIASIVWEYNSGHSAFKAALKSMQSGNIQGARQGAMIVTILAMACFDEGWCEIWDGLKRKASSDLEVSEALLSQLDDNARIFGDVYSVIALTNLWLTKKNGTKNIRFILTSDLAKIVITTLNSKSQEIRKLCVDYKSLSSEYEYAQIKELLYALGTFPVNINNKELLSHTEENLFVSAFMQTMYEKSKDDVEIDQVAIAIACLFYCWDINKFTDVWGSEICRGMPSEYVRKDLCSLREQNHFELIRSSLVNFEKAYAQQQEESANTISPVNKVFMFFRRGNFLEAARACINSVETGGLPNYTNLAFLMRYGKLNGSDIIEGKNFNIPGLLKLGVAQKDSYALINMALYEISNQRNSEAIKLIEQITPQGWEDISSNFWLPELWTTKKDPEGALVCVLSHVFGDCKFDEYKEMLECVKINYSLLSSQIIK